MSQSPTAVQARARQKGVETSPKLGANLYLWVQWRLAQERTVLSGWWGDGCAPQPGRPAKLPDPSPEGHLGMRVHPGSMENTSSTGSRQDDAKRGAPCWGLLAPGHHGSATPPMETDGSLANAPTHETQMPVIHHLPRGTRSFWQAPSPPLPGSGTSYFFHV